MLKIVAKFIVEEDKVEEFKKHAEILSIESRKEAGCISYQLLQNVDNSEMLFFIEEWENQEAIDKHNNSKHFTELLPKLTANLKEDPSINVNNIVV